MKKNTRYFTMMLGCLLVIAMVCSQFFGLSSTRYENKKATTKTEQSEHTEDQACYISLPSFSLPSPVHVQINLDSHCLFEITYEDKQACNTSLDAENFTKKLFTTLFRVIISPNAP